ncbi:procathepsin L-like [Ruditapes philippinarum]|uniref:procathepsin L-like n=1 Tax=Ruditapes philippinarum TaxID=129788 RepID=UPI00295B1F8A|nr:procathepsin L-like [Ruditapes philippinarum]
MKTTQCLFYILVLLPVVYTLPYLHSEWKLWKKKYGKMYDTKNEEKIHFDNWKKNYEYVINHNKMGDRGFSLEVNQFADQKILRPSPSLPNNEGHKLQDNADLIFVPKSQSAPASWDWREKGAITAVKNQGQLGDVQSIVTEECVESYGQIKTGELVAVSKIEIHDCCVHQHFVTEDIFGCIHNMGGVCSEADYPQTPGQCRNNTCTPAIQIHGGMKVPVGNETALMDAVFKMPVMALIDASHASFQLYRSGIYSEPLCKSTQLDHAVQVVGYGSMNGRDYWICKNSWGVNWGDRGYILMARNKGNMCGIASFASYPV